MSKSLFLILFLIPTLLFAQKTKKKIKEYAQVYTVYYVLKSDDTTKHGKYEMLLNGTEEVLVEGQFQLGKKEGVWTEYFPCLKQVKSKGNYKNDSLVGVWEYFDNDGELLKKINLDNNTVIFDSKRDNKTAVILGSDTVQVKLEATPFYKDSAKLETVFNQMRVPDMAKSNNKEGVVIITITIDTDGRAYNPVLKKGLGYGMNEEALKTVNRLLDNWSPGILNGESVKTIYDMKVSFRLCY